MANVNPMELLCMAEDISEDIEISKESIEELFQDYDGMRTYLANPIALIDKIKCEKGIRV